MPRRIATVDAVKRAYVCPVAVPALERVRLMEGVGSDSSVVVGEIARQLAVGVGLGKEVPSLLLDNPPRRRRRPRSEAATDAALATLP
jgi:hypothetical protein